MPVNRVNSDKYGDFQRRAFRQLLDFLDLFGVLNNQKRSDQALF